MERDRFELFYDETFVENWHSVEVTLTGLFQQKCNLFCSLHLQKCLRGFFGKPPPQCELTWFFVKRYVVCTKLYMYVETD